MVDPKKASELANVYTASDLVDADIRFGVDDAVNALSAQLSLAELKKVANVVTAANVAALYALTYAIDNQLYQTLGYTTEGIGANLYRYDSGSSATPDYGFTLDGIGGDGTGTGTGRFIAVDKSVADVTKFGAIGDGVADDTAEIQLAIDASATDIHGGSNSTYGRPIVFIPSGLYKTSDELTLGQRQTVLGQGRGSTKIVFTPADGSTEGLACISAKGGPTSNDYIYEPEIRDLTIELETTSQTANERYGIYFVYPTRAVVSDVQIRTGTLTSKDWVAIRTGREQGIYKNLFLYQFPVSIQLDLCDNLSISDVVYYNGSSTPNALPRTAIYAAPSAQLDRVSFTGKHVVVGFSSAVEWKYTGGVSADGIYLSGFRCEQPATTTAYRFDFGGTSIVRNVVMRDIGVSGNSNLFRGGSNTMNVDLDSVFYEPGTGSKTALTLSGMSPSNYNYFSAEKCYFANSPAAVVSGFTGAYTSMTLPIRTSSRDWVFAWPNAPATYYVANSFRNYTTANTGATDLDDLTTSGILDGHEITIFVDANTTVKDNATQVLADGLDFAPGPSTGFIKLQIRSGVWYETGRSYSGVNLEASTAGSGAPNTLAAAEAGKVLTNEGTTVVNYHTLPTAVAGLTFTFVVQDVDGLRITANTGDTIRLGSKVTAAAGYIESTTIGDYVTVTAINDTEWIGVAYGTWTNGTWTYTVVTST